MTLRDRPWGTEPALAEQRRRARRVRQHAAAVDGPADRGAAAADARRVLALFDQAAGDGEERPGRLRPAAYRTAWRARHEATLQRWLGATAHRKRWLDAGGAALRLLHKAQGSTACTT